MKANPRIKHFCRKARSSRPLAGTGSQTEEMKPAQKGEHGQIRGPRRSASMTRATRRRGESKVTGKYAPFSQIMPVLRVCPEEVTQKEGENMYIHTYMCIDRETQIPTATNGAKGLQTARLFNPHNNPVK